MEQTIAAQDLVERLGEGGGLGIAVDRFKVTGAWAAEKIGRLKLNGRLREYSPLSRFVELDFLAMGIWGQFVYVHPGHRIVIVKTSTDPGYAGRERETVRVCVKRTLAEVGLRREDVPGLDASEHLWSRGIGVHHAGLLPGANIPSGPGFVDAKNAAAVDEQAGVNR